MIIFKKFSLFTPFLCFTMVSLSGGDDLADGIGTLFEERAKSVVAIEYFIQSEIDRSPVDTVGLVIDHEGLIVINKSAVPNWLPPDQFKDFVVFPPGEGGDGYKAEYLGSDHLNGWNYLRVEEALWPRLVPIIEFETTSAVMGQKLWGIGILDQNFDYKAYFLDGRMAMMQKVPLKFGFSEGFLASPGCPVFDFEGRFAGWAGNPVTRERILLLDGRQSRVGFRPIRESGAFLFADEFLANVGRVPSDPAGDPSPWIGIAGMQPIDREVAGFLGLEDQGAVVVSTILEGSPAESSALQSRDIIVAVDGEAIPKFRPDQIVQSYFERQVLLKKPGETLTLEVVRGDGREHVEIVVGDQPTPLKKARRQYLADLGLTVREFVVYDAIRQRIPFLDAPGVIAQFVKPNSPVHAAGLKLSDWIKEIDGQAVSSYEEALDLLSSIEDDEAREEFVLLIDRNNQTSVLRVKLR